MAAFASPIDICNRGMDHVGARVISSFADGSPNSVRCAEVYDKLRLDELRRNDWVFSTRKAALRPIDTTTMQLVPNSYSATTQYYCGDIIVYNSVFYICIQATLGGVPPVDSNGEGSASWDNYFGPLTVDMWQSPIPEPSTTLSVYPTAYHSGEIVYVAPGNGTFSAFISMVDDNCDDPLGTDAFNLTTMYSAGQIVLGSNGTLYESAVSLNTGNDPTIVIPATAWASGTTYAAGAYVYDSSNNQIYQSNASGNVGNQPSYNSAYWTYTGMWTGTWTTVLTPQPRATSNKWHFLSCNLQPINLVFPVGSSPLSNTGARNLYMLPAGFLRQAANEEQLGNRQSWLGAYDPPAEELIFQGRFIISWYRWVLVLRFISDFQNVSMMDPLFCEGLGARIGDELCEKVTQAADKKNFCVAQYDRAIAAARMQNAIEVGSVQLVEDEYVRVRL